MAQLQFRYKQGELHYEKSFTRAQYGITIVLTPDCSPAHDDEDASEGKGFVTMQTDITFDTTKPSPDDRPLVDKRHMSERGPRSGWPDGNYRWPSSKI